MHLQEMTKYIKGEAIFAHPHSEAAELKYGEQSKQCHSRRGGPSPGSPFEFFPVNTGTVHYGETISAEGNCFEKVEMRLEKESAGKAKLYIAGSGRRSALCEDNFLFANTEILHFEMIALGGHKVIELNVPGEAAQTDLELRGLSTFLFCEAFQDELLSVLNTAKAFVGGLGLHGKDPLFQPKVPKYMEDANKEFL